MLDEWIRKTKDTDGEKKTLFTGKNRKYVLIILICIGLLALLWPTSNRSQLTPLPASLEVESQNRPAYTMELESILSQIEGAGEVKVSITLVSDGVKTYATNVRNETRETKESDSKGVTKNSREENLSQDIAVSSGNPLLIEEKYPEVLGVLIVSDGASSPVVQEKLVNATATLLNISSHKVRVMPRKGGE
ncbi:MAG: hypothetical protein GX550_02840 [Syntrophomonadaceae bacterium]|nr:hypothetical protein [Syntrophomonadaceae bacterium]